MIYVPEIENACIMEEEDRVEYWLYPTGSRISGQIPNSEQKPFIPDR